MNNYSIKEIIIAREKLLEIIKNNPTDKSVLKSDIFKSLFRQIAEVPPGQKKQFGEQLNQLKQEVANSLSSDSTDSAKPAIDVTAPFDKNVPLGLKPKTLNAENGTIHPLNTEMTKIIDIYSRLGFSVVESRQIDNDYNMFEALNFPEGHPARDDYDTFVTEDGLIAPAHTSTMQNRVLKANKYRLEKGEPIAFVIPGRVFRNEDLDATHEHTFHQIEGVFVDKKINVGNLIAVLNSFMNNYFGENLKAKIQPFYFPFTEPSFEFAIERPASLKKGSTEADNWLELLGCGMIHPEVLKQAGIDPDQHSGFAWGGGIERLVLMKNSIEDIRHFESGNLDFLRQFV